MGYYIFKYILDAFTLKEDTTIDGKVSKYGELAVCETYLSEIQTKKNSYWK